MGGGKIILKVVNEDKVLLDTTNIANQACINISKKYKSGRFTRHKSSNTTIYLWKKEKGKERVISRACKFNTKADRDRCWEKLLKTTGLGHKMVEGAITKSRRRLVRYLPIHKTLEEILGASA